MLSNRKVEVVRSYVYLDVTFSVRWSKFLMAQASKDRLTRQNASLSPLERQCHYAYFQEPRIKGWLFDSSVTSSLMFVAVVWTLRLPPFMWAPLERQLVTLWSCSTFLVFPCSWKTFYVKCWWTLATLLSTFCNLFSAFPLMRQKTKEEPDVLGCRVSKQLDVMWKQYWK